MRRRGSTRALDATLRGSCRKGEVPLDAEGEALPGCPAIRQRFVLRKASRLPGSRSLWSIVGCERRAARFGIILPGCPALRFSPNSVGANRYGNRSQHPDELPPTPVRRRDPRSWNRSGSPDDLVSGTPAPLPTRDRHRIRRPPVRTGIRVRPRRLPAPACGPRPHRMRRGLGAGSDPDLQAFPGTGRERIPHYGYDSRFPSRRRGRDRTATPCCT